MKIFFSLLLLVNIAFGLVQWLLPYEQLVVKNKSYPVAEELKLLTKTEVSVPLINSTESSETQTNESLVTEDTSDKRICFTIGPFKDKSLALEVSGRYSANQVETELKSSAEKEYLGVMVFISGHDSRQDAVDTAEALAKQGVHDYIIINEPGKSNALSLGVFGLKKNAERRISKLKALNYSVESEPRYRQRTIFWLYNQHSNEADMQALLNPDDIGKGISQIPRKCS